MTLSQIVGEELPELATAKAPWPVAVTLEIRGEAELLKIAAAQLLPLC